MTSYRITAQTADGPVREVRIEAADLPTAFRAASAWARIDPAAGIVVGPIEDGQWTWMCTRCSAEGPPWTTADAAHEDAHTYHRHCQEG